jgi:hypothetical protein
MQSIAAKILCITTAVLGLVACAPSISTAEASVLAKEVRPLLEVMCGGGGDVAPAAWPSSLQALEPDLVHVTMEGLYARTSKFFVSDRGVFVACHPDQFVPMRGSDPSYEAVSAGVYTYYLAG